jgi:hypothetical protein
MKNLLKLMALIAAATTITYAVQLAWDPNPEPDLAGYKLYWSLTPGGPYTNKVDVGNVTNYTIANTNFAFMKTNYFVATAYNTSGLESTYSNEINWVRTNSVPPTATKNLRTIGVN